MSGTRTRSLGGNGGRPGFSEAQPPNEPWWWVPVAVVATSVPVSLVAVPALDALGPYLPVPGTLLVGLYWSFVVGCWLFSPLAVFYDRQHVLELSGWLPPAYYYAVFVPAVGALVAAAYVVQRYRHVGFA